MSPAPLRNPDGPALCVMFLTYNRLDYAIATLDRLAKFAHYSRGPLRFHIATDGDTPEYIETLQEAIRGYNVFGEVSASNSQRRGYGANYNLATQVIHQLPNIRYVLPLEDDWELSRILNLDGLTLALDYAGEDNHPGDFIPGCIRLSYLGYTQRFDCHLEWINGDNYLVLHDTSSELHVFSGNPRVETVEWERQVGLWPENRTPGETEVDVARRFEARCGVCFPIDLIHPKGDLFYHIGTMKSSQEGLVLANG